MLAGAHLPEDVARYPGPLLVACGSADTVTPEPGCRAIAAAALKVAVVLAALAFAKVTVPGPLNMDQFVVSVPFGRMRMPAVVESSFAPRNIMDRLSSASVPFASTTI